MVKMKIIKAEINLSNSKNNVNNNRKPRKAWGTPRERVDNADRDTIKSIEFAMPVFEFLSE